jgi:hypothetical protein
MAASSRRAATGRAVAEVPWLDNSHRRNRTLFQINHFYCSKKNTAEMIRVMNMLVDQYRDRRQIYLSWDAASWHVSKELNKHIEGHNRTGLGPIVAVAPLPARAQFLNIIESVFSGMARAISHNSDYKSPLPAASPDSSRASDSKVALRAPCWRWRNAGTASP